MASRSDYPRYRRRIVVVGVVAFGLVAAAAMWETNVRIENDLTGASRRELRAAGIDTTAVRISFSGQDGSLCGFASDAEAARARDVVASISGVRDGGLSVSTACAGGSGGSGGTSGTSSTVTTAPGSTTATTAAGSTVPGAGALNVIATYGSDGRFVLAGSTDTDAQRQRIVDAATSTAGPANVDATGLAVKAGAPPATVTVDDTTAAQLAGLVAVLPHNTAKGAASAVPGKGLALSGVYVDVAAKATIDAAVKAAGTTVATDLTPRPTASATDKAQLQQQLDAVLAGTTIPFAPNSAQLQPAALPLLQRSAAAMKQFAGVQIEVQGHTDSDGTPATNLTLSQQRADAVKNALQLLGVPATELTAKGYGDTRPVAPNDTPENKAKNRRVVFVVAP